MKNKMMRALTKKQATVTLYRVGQRLKTIIGLSVLLTLLWGNPSNALADSIVVSHDINTFGTDVAGSQEATFAVNVANFLTSGDPTKNLLLFESNSDGSRNFATNVLDALTNSGFTVTRTSDYTTPFYSFDAIFVAQDFPKVGFLNNTALINYVDGGGGVYLSGGVGGPAPIEAAGWNNFLNHYGLAFSSVYNNIYNVTVTSTHPLFAGITALGSGNGQSIIDLGTNPNTQIVQTQGGQGMYAVYESSAPAPEPATILLFGTGIAGLAVCRIRRKK